MKKNLISNIILFFYKSIKSISEDFLSAFLTTLNSYPKKSKISWTLLNFIEPVFSIFENPTRCSLGYYLKDNACIKCEAGYFCPDGSGKNSCTNTGYTSLEGAKADSECFLAYQGKTFYQVAT